MKSQVPKGPPLDEGRRGSVGVLVSVRQEPDGTYRLHLDDVEPMSNELYPTWKTWSFVTSTSMSRDEFLVRPRRTPFLRISSSGRRYFFQFSGCWSQPSRSRGSVTVFGTAIAA